MEDSVIFVSSESDISSDSPGKLSLRETLNLVKDVFDQDDSSSDDDDEKNRKYSTSSLRDDKSGASSLGSNVASRRRQSSSGNHHTPAKKKRFSLHLENPDLFDAELSEDDITPGDKGHSHNSTTSLIDSEDSRCTEVNSNRCNFTFGNSFTDSDAESDLPDLELPFTDALVKRENKKEERKTPEESNSIKDRKKSEPSTYLFGSQQRDRLRGLFRSIKQPSSVSAPKQRSPSPELSSDIDSNISSTKNEKHRHFLDVISISSSSTIGYDVDERSLESPVSHSSNENDVPAKSPPTFSPTCEIDNPAKSPPAFSPTCEIDNPAKSPPAFSPTCEIDNPAKSPPAFSPTCELHVDTPEKNIIQEKSRPAGVLQPRRVTRCKTKNHHLTIVSNRFGNLISSRLEHVSAKLDTHRCVHRFLEDQRMCLTSPALHARTAHHPLRDLKHDSKKEYFLVTKFSDVQVTTFMFCDEEKDLVSQTLDLANAFTNSETEPPVEVLKTLLGILRNSSESFHTHKAYCVLKRIQQLHIPKETVHFGFHDLEAAFNSVKLEGYGHRTIGNILALHYMTSVLEDELTHRHVTTRRGLLKSAAWKMFQIDSNFRRIELLIQWIGAAVNFDEFESLVTTLEKLQLAPNPRINTEEELSQVAENVPKILPILQKLLSLALCVSHQPETDAARIATQYAQLYPQMTSNFCTKLMITSINNPYLKMKVIQRVLEDYSPNSMYACGNIHDLDELIKAYFSLQPPQSSSFTPPPTPNDDDEVEVVVSLQCSPESCEELSFLLYSLVASYLVNAKSKYNYNLARRVTEGIKPTTLPLSTADKNTLRHMGAHVDSLKSWLATLTSELTTKTHQYIFQLHCLSECI